MWGYPKTVKLTDGTDVSLQVLSKDLRQKEIKFFRGLDKEDRLFLRYDVTDIKRLDERLNNIDYNRLIPLVAVHKGAIIGDATLEQAPYGWTRHLAEIRIVVASAFQGKGLATLLAHELSNLALEKDIEQIEARVIGIQTGALKVFKKLGYKLYVKLPNYVHDLQNKTHDLIILHRDLRVIKHRFQEDGHLPSRY
jgi:RimJ/RimL family protein N-acetyltransferase